MSVCARHISPVDFPRIFHAKRFINLFVGLHIYVYDDEFYILSFSHEPAGVCVETFNTTPCGPGSGLMIKYLYTCKENDVAWKKLSKNIKVKSIFNATYNRTNIKPIKHLIVYYLSVLIYRFLRMVL